MIVVFYTGKGANKNGIHTVDRFLQLMINKKKNVKQYIEKGGSKYRLAQILADNVGGSLYEVISTKSGPKIRNKYVYRP